MNIIPAILLYVIIAVSIMQNWLVLSVLSVVFFSFRYNAAFLIPLAILIDGYYGNFYSIPYLSFFSVGWFLVVEYLRPKINFLSHNYE